jgi:hypothetical protein
VRLWKAGDEVDALDSYGVWYEGVIAEVRRE